MQVRDLKGKNVAVIERAGERWFIDDLFELEEMGEHVPTLDERISDYTLFDKSYHQIKSEDVHG